MLLHFDCYSWMKRFRSNKALVSGKVTKWLKLYASAVWMQEAENAQDTDQASLSPAVALWTSSSRMGTMRLSLDIRLYFITKRVKRWHKKVSFCGREIIQCQSDANLKHLLGNCLLLTIAGIVASMNRSCFVMNTVIIMLRGHYIKVNANTEIC